MAERLTKSERTRQRILDAAAKVFREQGYANARLADIAELADMQTGSLYYHFDGREDLVAEILRLGVETSWQHVRDGRRRPARRAPRRSSGWPRRCGPTRCRCWRSATTPRPRPASSARCRRRC